MKPATPTAVSPTMAAFRHHLSSCRRAALTGVLALAGALSAATGSFFSDLSAHQQATAGLSALSPAERTALDQLVAAELASGRRLLQDEISGSFVNRRTAEERQASGLDRLSAAELARLDELVAAALMLRPKPKERPRLKDDEVVSAARKLEIHGAVTLTYGWNRGGSFHGASLWLDYFDPASGLSLGIGLSNFTGPGYYGGPGYSGYYPDDYGYGYGARLAAPFSFYSDLPDRGRSRHDFLLGDGPSIRGMAIRDSFDPGRRRR